MLAAGVGAAAVASFVWMTSIWVVSLRRRDASIVDPGWGPGFVVVALVATTVAGAWREPRAWLFVGIISLWGPRLGLHLLRRNLLLGEDPRYAKWRRQHGERWWWRSYLQVFLLQGVILWIVALVFVEPLARGGSVGPLALAGVAVALGGIAFEAVADAQLARFRADRTSAGRVLDSGLWRYSRHPNYFGESVIWWGLWLVALGVGGAWWTVISPVLMTVLLLKVSGVTLLEKHMETRKPRYADYVRRTSAFVPLPPKRS